MQKSLQRRSMVLTVADNFVLNFAVSILVDKVVLPLLFPIKLFRFHERRNFRLLFIWIYSSSGIRGGFCFLIIGSPSFKRISCNDFSTWHNLPLHSVGDCHFRLRSLWFTWFLLLILPFLVTKPGDNIINSKSAI